MTQLTSPRPPVPQPEPAQSAEPTAAESASSGSGTVQAALRSAAHSLRVSAAAAGPAILVYVILRVLSLATLTSLAEYARIRQPGKLVHYDGSHNMWRGWTSALDVLLSWDGRWYVLLATEGYAGPIGGADANGVGYYIRPSFFPLYPYTARALAELPLINPTVACLLVSSVSAIVAAWAMFAIGAHIHSRRFGLMLAALWAVAPANLAQNGAFTESLFTALAGWSLFAVLKRRWLTAAGLASIAGLTRPTALVLAGTVGLAALVALIQGRDKWWRLFAAMAIAPLGYAGYIWHATQRLGGGNAYFDVQRIHFGSYFDFGVSTVETVTHLLLGVGDEQDKPVRVLSVLLLLAAIVLTVLAALERIPWVLVVFAVAVLVASAGSHSHISMINRHILPAFPILVVPALVLARAPARTAAVLLPALAILSAYYGAWLPFVSGQAL